MKTLAIFLAMALAAAAEQASYSTDFEFLWKSLGEKVPADLMKARGVDWAAVRKTYAPLAKAAKTDVEFARVCSDLVQQLRDGHAYVECKTVKPEDLFDATASMNPGLGLVECQGGRFMVLSAYRDAAAAGLKRGMIVLTVDGVDAAKVATKAADETWKRGGFSSARGARFGAVWNLLSGKLDTEVKLTVETEPGKQKEFTLKRTLRLLRCPKPKEWYAPEGLKTEGRDTTWALLDESWGLIQSARFGDDDGGKAAIETALAGLKDAKGLILDVRGNGGGGVPSIAWPEDKPIAILIDPGTLSAGEGFAGHFGDTSKNPKRRATIRLFGATTAGSSGEKTHLSTPSGLVTAHFVSRGYKGSLNCGPGGMIEFYGVHPDVEVLPDPALAAKGEDACVEKAKAFLKNPAAK
jgi:C-terminal processing protease CtpA/Prc